MITMTIRLRLIPREESRLIFVSGESLDWWLKLLLFVRSDGINIRDGACSTG